MERDVIFFYEKRIINDPDKLAAKILSLSYQEINFLVQNIPQVKIEASNIPQYSNFYNGTINMISYLRMSGNYGPTFIEIGKHFMRNKNDAAYRKYGENHVKLAQMLGLVNFKKRNSIQAFLNPLGISVEKMSEPDKLNVISKLTGLIPIVQYAIINQLNDVLDLQTVLMKYLSEKTAVRRRKNCWDLVEMFRKEDVK